MVDITEAQMVAAQLTNNGSSRYMGSLHAKYAKDLAYALQCALDRSRAQVLALENELSNAFSYAANSPIFKIA